MIKQKYFKFCCIFTVSNLLDSTNLIKLISLCFSYNFSVADSLTTCVTLFFLKTYNWFCRMQLILILNCFLNSVNLFIFFLHHSIIFFQNNVLLIFSDHFQLPWSWHVCHTFLFSPFWLEMAAAVFFKYGYFQQAHVHISEAITTD